MTPPLDPAAARSTTVFRLALLWLIGANMRTVILALPPVLPVIHQQLHLSETEVGLITTLPVLLFGLGAIGGSVAVARLGPRTTLALGLMVVGGASALRGAGGAPLLFAASIALGLAIAVVQPALPTLAHAWFGARTALATTVYSNGFIVGEAVAASLTIPVLLPLVGSWRWSVAAWGVPCVVTGILVMAAAHVPRAAGEEVLGWSPRLGSATTWRLGVLQGGGSTVYFGLNAFLPTELHAVNHGSMVTGCLAALNISQLAAVLIIPVLARRRIRAAGFMATCGVASLGAVALIAFLPGPWAVVGSGIAGACSACCFVVCFALPPAVAPGNEVHQVTAGMLTIGYTMAFALPLVGGLVWDSTGQPRAAFVPAAVGAVLFGTALSLRRPSPDGAEPPGTRLA